LSGLVRNSISNNVKSLFESKLYEDVHTNKKYNNLVQHEETRINKGRPPISKAVLNENRVYTTNRVKEVQLNNAPFHESSPISRSSLFHKKCTDL
jgi:hypothetical protein